MLVVAPLCAALGCGSVKQLFEPANEPLSGPRAAADEPPPLHTGGLSVLKGHPEDRSFHGDRAAAAVAAAIAAPALGAAAVTTLVDCAAPDAGADCLAGPGAGSEGAGAPAEPLQMQTDWRAIPATALPPP